MRHCEQFGYFLIRNCHYYIFNKKPSIRFYIFYAFYPLFWFFVFFVYRGYCLFILMFYAYNPNLIRIAYCKLHLVNNTY